MAEETCDTSFSYLSHQWVRQHKRTDFTVGGLNFVSIGTSRCATLYNFSGLLLALADRIITVFAALSHTIRLHIDIVIPSGNQLGRMTSDYIFAT